MSNRTYVYTGPWVNYSYPTIIGATYTFTTQNAAFLLVFLAIYITVAGGQFWNIIAFIAHHHGAPARGHEGPRDGFLGKIQIILRNAGGPWTVAQQIISVWWSSRKTGVSRKFICRFLFLLVLAVGTAAIFALASIFTSWVTEAASQDVLILGNNCGYWHLPLAASLDLVQSYNTKILTDSIASATYARACYSVPGISDTGRPQNCDVYIKKQLNWTTNASASCPFASGMCLVGDTGAFAMDTGPINSHDDLGLDAPAQERINFRRVTTCAPIKIIGFEQNRTTGGGRWEDLFYYYQYGPHGGVNYTYFYNTHALVDSLGYGLKTVMAISNPRSEQAWTPIPRLNRTDADISLFFLTQNSVRYVSKVEDPWFTAHIIRNTTILGQQSVWYKADRSVQVLGCIDQYQVCNPNINPGGVETGCTTLAGSNELFSSYLYLGLSKVQLATVYRILYSIGENGIWNSVSSRGASALNAMETLYELDQAPMPSNQWTIETNAWFATSLAWIQKSVVEYASGPVNIAEGGFIYHPSEEEDKQMCTRRIIGKVAGYQNFSQLGIWFIISVGGVFIISGLFIDKIFGVIQRCRCCRTADAASLIDWNADDKLQLASELESARSRLYELSAVGASSEES